MSGWAQRAAEEADDDRQELRDLRAEVSGLRKDAERYRWLRDKADFVRRKDGSPQVCFTDEWGEIVSVKASAYPQGAVLDAAIDAELGRGAARQAGEQHDQKHAHGGLPGELAADPTS